MGDDRLVRHLRLRAPHQAAARGVLPVLEDALRCASLGPGDGRVRVVRHLALGRIAPGSSAQQLALLIERRVAEAGGTWVEGGTPQAEHATHVVFASRLDARIALALRLVRGAPVSAWYWRAAVPELRAAHTAHEVLRRIALEIVRWPEAAKALPVWCAQVVRGGGAAALAAAIDEAQGEALLRAAGVSVPLIDGSDEQPEAPAVLAPATDRASQPTRLPHWLATALRWVGPRDTVPSMPRDSFPAAQAVPQRIVSSPRAPFQQDAPLLAEVARSTRHASATPPSRAPRHPSRQTPTAGTDPMPFEGTPSAYAGLLFVLPVLARLGLPEWLVGHDDDRFAARVLNAALCRLRAEEGDPAWTLAQTQTQTQAQAHGADAQVAAWLTAARHWLRRDARIGLASLVVRPGRIAWTETHVDIHFALDACELRIRRAGLDLDPGWLPWFGHVVSFHYGQDPWARTPPN